MTERHSTLAEIEAVHVGATLPPVDAHLSRCGGCRARVEEFDAARDAFLAARPAETFVRRLRDRVEKQSVSSRWTGARLRTLQLGSVAAATFVFYLVVGTSGGPAIDSRLELDGKATMTLSQEDTSDWVVKGADGPALIVRRGEKQAFERGPVTIIPEDELRLHFELTEPGLIKAGIMTDSGEWVELVEGEFGVGQHTPEATLRVDDQPSSGTLLLGSPAEVDKARAGDTNARVQRLRLEWKGAPGVSHGAGPLQQ